MAERLRESFCLGGAPGSAGIPTGSKPRNLEGCHPLAGGLSEPTLSRIGSHETAYWLTEGGGNAFRSKLGFIGGNNRARGDVEDVGPSLDSM